MIRSMDDIRATATKLGLTPSVVARACDPPLPIPTVWRILKGERRGNGDTQERISAAIDKLVMAAPAEKAVA